MAEEQRRGYPIDLRTDRQRWRAFNGYDGDFELAAARVVARLTGERVVIQDDNSSPGMADIRIEYRDWPTAFLEVVTDVDRRYAELASQVRGQRHVRAPGLGRVWFLTLSSKARIGRLERELPAILAGLQHDGAVFETVETSPQHHPFAEVRDLGNRGVVQLASRPVRSDDDGTGRIVLLAEGTGGKAGLDWSSFDDWLFAFLNASATADVRRKLVAAGGAERHAFVGVSFSSPWSVAYALSSDIVALPPVPPRLPAEITHIWLWWYPFGRCIAWFPDRGWLDPSRCWATD